MINLKKNDKIIIVIAVAVIIIAGIGIALYIPPEETIIEEENGKNTYIVEWDIMSGPSTMISEYAGKRSPYEGTYSIDQANIKSIKFNLTWIDDKAFLGRLGRDTLTLEITNPDGDVIEESSQSAPQSKFGNVELTIIVSGSAPSSQPIEAVDEFDAQDQLMQEPYYNDKWVNEEFTIRVGCNVGEILGNLRPRDKGNSFDLEISYDYYDASLMQEETMETGSDNDSFGDYDDEGYTSAFMSMLYNGCGGRSF
jgi:hypothetical protein